MKNSFTMIELVFVIVIIGILAGIAIPRLFPAVTTAKYKKLETQVSAIRAGIQNVYSKNIINGNNKCPSLEKSTTDDTLFENILTYPITKNSGDIKWDGNGTEYNATIGDTVIKFEYNTSTESNCKFECNSTEAICNKISE